MGFECRTLSRGISRARRGALIAAALVATMAAVATGSVATAPTAAAAPPPVGATLHGQGSVEEAWLTGANPGDRIELREDGSAVANPANPGTADSLGTLIIRNLTPGGGYDWVDLTTGQRTDRFPVLAPGDNPRRNGPLYTGQPLHHGLNYITMRDGIQLAATVRYPYGGTCSDTAPCPTVIEYSGYNTAAPTDPVPALISQALHAPCTGCGDPNLLPDTATAVGIRPRPDLRVRHGQPPDARHGVLGWGLRPVRVPVGLRRL